MQLEHHMPVTAVDNKGILLQVESRCTPEQQRTAYDADRVTYCHELSHQLHSALRNSRQSFVPRSNSSARMMLCPPEFWYSFGPDTNAFFVGNNDGSYIKLREPNITLAQVANIVDKSMRTSAYDLYLVQQQQYWNEQPLYVLDEQASYMNGSQCAIEEKLDDHGSHDRVEWFCHYAVCLVLTVQKYDPEYGELFLLREFVAYQNVRAVQMLTGVRTPTSGRWPV